MSSAVDDSVVVAAAITTRRGRPRRQYTCAYCDKAFKRSEHRTRHERTHTQEKPFVCRYCRKSYSRKDLVTRHERTLHADAHQKRQSQDSELVEQIEVACPTPRQSVALQLQPDDEEPDSLNGQDLSVREVPSPADDVAFSLSPLSPLSLNPTPLDERRLSFHSPATVLGHTQGNLPMHQTRSPPTASTAPRHEYPSPPAAHTSPSQADPGRRYSTSNTVSFHPGTGRRSLEMMEPNIPIDMDLPLSQGINDNNDATQHQHNTHYHPESSEPQDQDQTRFFFSPMPTFDIDLSAFLFSPTLHQPAQAHRDLPMSLMTDDFTLQNLPGKDMQAFSHLDNLPSQIFTDQRAPNQSTASSDTPKSQTNGDVLPLFRENRHPHPAIALDNTAYEAIRNDLAQRLAVPDTELDIPPARVCQGFLSSYITSFHGHLPIIHLRSFCPRTTPSPLILTICSIGALYRLDRRRARRLYDTAVRALDIVALPSQNDQQALVKGYCLWFVQARMLLAFYAVMSGDRDLLVSTFHVNGFFTLMYNKARMALGGNSTNPSRMSWYEWIERESWKRLLGGLIVASTLSMVLFDVNPGFNATQDLEFETYDDEAIWNAASSTEWREIRASSLNQQHPERRRTMKEVLVDIMLEGKYHPNTAPYQVSALSALILMHGVVVHMWQRLQVSQAFATPLGSTFLPDTSSDKLSSSLLDSAMRTLKRCGNFLASNGSEVNPLDSADEETSLAFNCQAILRIAYIRLFKPISPTNGINLLSLNPDEMDEAITSFVTAKIERGPHFLHAVTQCVEGLRIPVKLGHMLVRKTAAFRWSVEHAIAGWESALLVTKWIDSVELDNSNGTQPSLKERELLTLIKNVLEEAECDFSESVSLAAAAARTWGSFLQDVWVWGITPRMGAALELLAQAYERVGKANGRVVLDASSLLC